SGSLSAIVINNPIRRNRYVCCARDMRGQATAPPTNAMNSRRNGRTATPKRCQGETNCPPPSARSDREQRKWQRPPWLANQCSDPVPRVVGRCVSSGHARLARCEAPSVYRLGDNHQAPRQQGSAGSASSPLGTHSRCLHASTLKTRIHLCLGRKRQRNVHP